MQASSLFSLLGCAACLMAALSPTGVAAQFSEANPPPLLPSEVLAFTRNACGIVVQTAPRESAKRVSGLATSQIASAALTGATELSGYVDLREESLDAAAQGVLRNIVARLHFTGDCSAGLAQGKGYLGDGQPTPLKFDVEYLHGRAIKADGKELGAGYEARVAAVMQPVLAAATLENEAKTGRAGVPVPGSRILAIEAAAAAKREQVVAAAAAEIRLAEEAKKSAAERERADKAFAASLTKLGPGELFNLADTRRRAGDAAQERLALRALISRFPNHALAGAAGQQLSRIPDTPVAPATPPPTQAQAAKETDDMAGVMDRKKK